MARTYASLGHVKSRVLKDGRVRYEAYAQGVYLGSFDRSEDAHAARVGVPKKSPWTMAGHVRQVNRDMVKYRADVRVNGHVYYCGVHSTADEAEMAIQRLLNSLC